MISKPPSAEISAEALRSLRRELAELRAELAGERRQRKLLQEIGRSLELERLLYVLGEETARLDAFDGYLINLVDRERTGLVCSKAVMPESLRGLCDAYLHFRFPFDENDANTRAYRGGEPVWLDADSVKAECGLTGRAFERWGARSMVLIPIPYCDGAIGTVMAFRQHAPIAPLAVARFRERLTLFNEQIRNALLYSELKRQEKEFQSALDEHRKFLEFVSQVNNLTSPEEIYEAIVKEFVRAFGFDIASVTLAEQGGLVAKAFGCVDPRYELVCERMRQARGGKPAELRHDEGVGVIAFLQNSHVLVQDAEALRHLPMGERDRLNLELMGTVRTVVQVPIRRHEQAIGVLGLYSIERPLNLADSDLKIIELLASFVGTAITNAQLYSVIGNQKGQIEELNQELQGKIERLNELVNKDQLTGLYNFGAFKAELFRRTREVDRSEGEPELALVIVDVDHFKQFNDSHGHVAGNLVLQEVASRIERLTRKLDLACRFGGEEFVVILPRCDLEGAAQFAERLRRSIAEEPFHIDEQALEVTASFGCATYVAGESAEDFIARADQALYRAKEAGRNRVERA